MPRIGWIGSSTGVVVVVAAAAAVVFTMYILGRAPRERRARSRFCHATLLHVLLHTLGWGWGGGGVLTFMFSSVTPDVFCGIYCYVDVIFSCKHVPLN